MKSITIHGIDDELDRILQQKARSEDSSLNKTIKRLLRQSLHIDEDKKMSPGQFDKFFGSWSKKDLKEFERATQDQEKIYKEDWA